MLRHLGREDHVDDVVPDRLVRVGIEILEYVHAVVVCGEIKGLKKRQTKKMNKLKKNEENLIVNHSQGVARVAEEGGRGAGVANVVRGCRDEL